MKRLLKTDNIQKVQEVFQGIWSLESFENDPEVQQAIDRALLNPHDFVLKPQKEGGGNNYYDDDIPTLLNKLRADPAANDDLRTYLIMERIKTPMTPFAALKNGEL